MLSPEEAFSPLIKPTGATTFLLQVGSDIDRTLTVRVAQFVDSLSKQADIPLVSVVPSYTTIGFKIDPERITLDVASSNVLNRWTDFTFEPYEEQIAGSEHRIPMVYGGDHGPDLPDVAAATGLTTGEVIRRHSEADYVVAAVGFAAGFSFLLGLPPELAVPRRSTPRLKVPGGSLGIGGVQTGVYPVESPGGWNLIGRTWKRLFDPFGRPDFELKVGDRVKFVPVDSSEFQVSGSLLDEPTTRSYSRHIEILEPGIHTSVQDLGRENQAPLGIAPNGAMDRSAFRAGNLLLSNPDTNAALEWTLMPPRLRFYIETTIALTGTDPGWQINGNPVNIGDVIEVSPGDELYAPPSGAPLTGARGYICVQGGIDVPEVRESRSLDELSRFGGGLGRHLRRGDILPVGDFSPPECAYSPSINTTSLVSPPYAKPFRVLRGPQADRFGSDSWSDFLNDTYTINQQSNRVAARLNSARWKPFGDVDIISEPNATGAIQVTSSGQLLLLLRGRATIGGYAKIANVIEADHDRLGQLPPGAKISFQEVTLEEATKALGTQRPSIVGGLAGDIDSKDTTNPFGDSDMNSWTPETVLKLIRTMGESGISSLSLKTEGFSLELRREDLNSAHSTSSGETSVFLRDDVTDRNPDSDQDADDYIVRAPFIGIFYRRRSPEEDPLCEVGDKVTDVSPVGVLEVMKTFNEIPAGRRGTVKAFLVEDGDPVEFGQPILQLAADKS